MASQAPYAAVPRALVADRQRVSPSGRDLYAVLTRYADRNFMAWPSQSALAEEMECSVRSIERAVKELREAGWVTVTRRWPGGPNLYRINTRPDPEAALAATASTPPEEHRTLTPPDKNDGTHPTDMAGRSYRYRRDRENLASATLAGVDEEVGREFDPEFIAGFQDGRESAPAAKTTGPRALALELRSQWMQYGPNPLAGDINVAAVAGQISAWRKSGVEVDEIRSMITLFVTSKGYHIPRADPWRAFLSRRKALLDAVRTTRAALAAENDPGYWSATGYDEKSEADAWYAAQYGAPAGA